jgi:hypothetical protein
MNLDNFESADYFHNVSMHAELDREIGGMLYRIIDKIDDAAKEAEFNIIYSLSEQCAEEQYVRLKTYLKKLKFGVEFLYKRGDIKEIAGMEISW